jgi:RNA polymerase sigma-70 factor (ECF subfamily)
MSDTSPSLLERLNDQTDTEAWRRMVDIYTPLIHGWLRRYGIAAPDADDLTQEVLSVVLRELPAFQHNKRRGAFRNWLRTITLNRLRQSWRLRRVHPEPTGGSQFAAMLDELADPTSALSRVWDQEHDRHVVHRLLAWVEPEFQPSTWSAFRMAVLEGHPTDHVAGSLGLTPNAVLIAKSRVLRRLREVSMGLIDGTT